MSSPWSVQRYRSPFLRVDSIDVSDGAVLVHADHETFELTTSDDKDLAKLSDLLHEMRNPASTVWEVLRAPNPWDTTVARLDQLGLLAEVDQDVPAAAQHAYAQLLEIVDHAGSWLEEALAIADPARAVTMRTMASEWQLIAEGYLHSHAEVSEPDLVTHAIAAPSPTAPESWNLLATSVRHQLRHWSRTAPHLLAAASVVLRRAAGEPVSRDDLADRVLNRLAAGPYEVRDVATGLTCLVEELVRATSPGARRRLERLVDLPPVPLSGINLMLHGERLALDALGVLGPSRYHRALLDRSHPRQLAVGTYVEQFHTTRRFVEIIVPALSKRLTDPLRSQMFDYYAEEIGHEIFELDTCVALGLDRDRVMASTPLAGWTTYLDVFCDISETDPIGFLASVMVTEGLPGTSTPVNELLARAGAMEDTSALEVMRQHEEVNIELDHTTLARRFLSDVAVIYPESAVRALDHMLMLLELNYRAWDELLDFYTGSGLPPQRTPFCTPPDVVLRQGLDRP